VTYVPPGGGAVPRRFDPKSVGLGVAAGLVGGVLLPVALGALASLGDIFGVFFAFAGLGLIVPVILGIVLATTPGSPRQRGFGLGLVIGWGLLVLLAGGLCVALVVGLSSA
jgi:hypothetical protein